MTSSDTLGLPAELQVTRATMEHHIRLKQSNANEIHLRLHSVTKELRSEVHWRLKLTVNIQELKDRLDRRPEDPVELMRGQIHWPPSARTQEGTVLLPLIVDHVNLPKGISCTYDGADANNSMIVQVNTFDDASFHAVSGTTDWGILECTFTSPTMAFLLTPDKRWTLRDREPYERLDLSVAITYSKLIRSDTLISLDYPEDMSFRVRRDNSTYHSQTLAIGNGYERKETYFAERHISLRYAFGTSVISKLTEPMVPMIRLGTSMMAGGIALWLLGASHNNANRWPISLAVPFVALAVGPWFIEIFSRKRLLNPSTMIGVVSANDIFSGICLIIYLCGLLILGSLVSWGNAAMQLTWGTYVLWFGIICNCIAALYTIATIMYGWRMGYACDRCEREFVVRRSSILGMWPVEHHKASRRTVCASCLQTLRAEYLVRKWFKDGVSSWNWELIDNLFSERYEHHGLGSSLAIESVSGRERMVSEWECIKQRHDKARVILTGIAGRDNLVAVEYRVEYVDMESESKDLVWQVFGEQQFRVEKDRIAEGWVVSVSSDTQDQN